MSKNADRFTYTLHTQVAKQYILYASQALYTIQIAVPISNLEKDQFLSFLYVDCFWIFLDNSNTDFWIISHCSDM